MRFVYELRIGSWGWHILTPPTACFLPSPPLDLDLWSLRDPVARYP
ncbi:MAG: hypothetical protein RL685_5527 [Pseudomonadota bacterium]|jgi:hypothetical protein